MIKLLIADDEPLVCVGLQSMIPWANYGIEIAGTARNGKQALEMIEKLRPEIVITDIKMPLKSGLEVAEECFGKYGSIPLFIILTSFEEFEFARRALLVQAVAYLVKLELSPESLGEAVSKALAALEKIRRTDHEGLLPENAEHTRGAAGLRDEFFRSLYQHRIENTEALRENLDKLGLNLFIPAAAPLYMTVVAGKISDDIAAGEGDSPRYLSAVWMLREMLEKLYPCYVTPMETGHFTLLLCLEEKDPAFLRTPLLWRKHYEAGLLKTIGILHDYFNVRIRMAAGKTVEDPLELDESYRSACEELEDMGSVGAKENPLRFFERSLQRQNHHQQLIAKVEGYIGRNLDKRLGLPDVAAEFNLSPNYLSQLFTRYAGEGFVEYITAAKITAAKSMLLKGEGPVYEIADKLGYESAFYFSKVFKKMEGISPREFLSRHKVAPLQGSEDL
ncbi:MAG: helix-turn-helix domain-containing protein [Treponema sp.]|jgi:two-component system response regulator YesN|nr:helix-turn-helix domain-containing protein [Treponema sp.]